MSFLKKNILFRLSFGVPFLFLFSLFFLQTPHALGVTKCGQGDVGTCMFACSTGLTPIADLTNKCTGFSTGGTQCCAPGGGGKCETLGGICTGSSGTTCLSEFRKSHDGTCVTLGQNCCTKETFPECPSVSCKGSCAVGDTEDSVSLCKDVYKKCCTSSSAGGAGSCGTPGTPPCSGTPAPGNPTTIPFDNSLKFDTVEGVLGSLLGALRGIIVVLALIAIVIGAILYITSAGNDSRMTLAKGAITAAMIGLAIGIAAPSFLLQIGDILGWGPVTSSLPPETRTLTAIALSVLQFLLSIVGTLAIIMLVVGGIMYMTAAGNEDRIDTGKKIVLYSIIGIAVALAALVIVTQIAVLFA